MMPDHSRDRRPEAPQWEPPVFTEQPETDLLTERAQEAGRRFAGKDPARSEKEVTSAQLRRFFHDFRALQAQVEAADDFSSVEAEVQMLRPKAAYARGRDAIPPGFHRFLEKNLKQVKSEKHFQQFMRLFEAVVGYYYGEGGGKR